jgi:hypothetical protein
MVERGAECIDVTSWFSDSPLLLRWSVVFGADHRAAVDEHEVAIGSKHDVRWLQITKDDRLGQVLVQLRQDVEYLECPLDKRRLGQGSVLPIDEVLEVLTVDVFEYQVDQAAV